MTTEVAPTIPPVRNGSNMSVRTMAILGRATACIVAMLLPATLCAQAAVPEAPNKSEVIASGGKLMTGDQVRKMYLENTVYHIWLVAFRGLQKGSMAPVFCPDERHCQSVFHGRKVEVLWWIDGDARCNESSDGGSPSCRVNYELNGKIFQCVRESDLCPAMLRVIPGKHPELLDQQFK